MNHLYFSKPERRALISLTVILCLTHIALLSIKWKEHKEGQQNYLLQVEVHGETVQASPQEKNEERTLKAEIPAFQKTKKPIDIKLESLNEAMLQSHNLPKQLIKNWVNYHNKGMRFKTQNDIMQVYGMTESIYRKIEPHLIFPPIKSGTKSEKKPKALDSSIEVESTAKVERIVEVEEEVIEVKKLKIQLNGADENELQQLYGIGKVLSGRIIKYRDLIGGYVSKKQLYNVYGLRSTLVDSLSDQIYIDGSTVQRVNVFEASIDELSQLYFVSPYLAKQIKQLTNSRYADVRNGADLEKHLDYNLEKLRQAIPYLDFTKPEEKNSD